MNLLTLGTASNAGIIPHQRLGTNGYKKHQYSLLWPQKEATEREREVNLGVDIKQPVCDCYVFNDPAELKPKRGHAEVSRPRWPTEQ